MKKVFAMRELDCANCARKIEEGIARLEGVQAVQISFLMQRMTLTADEECFDQILKKAQKICRRVDPDCEIVF